MNEKLLKTLQSSSFKALLINKRGFKLYNGMELSRGKKNFCAVVEPFLCREEEKGGGREGWKIAPPFGWCREGAAAAG